MRRAGPRPAAPGLAERRPSSGREPASLRKWPWPERTGRCRHRRPARGCGDPDEDPARPVLCPAADLPGRSRVRPSGSLPCAEDVMSGTRQWSDLSERNRRLLIAAAVAETCLKVAALIDIKRRPASQIRGRKWMWATVVTLVNSFGAAPLSYFAFGRRR